MDIASISRLLTTIVVVCINYLSAYSFLLYIHTDIYSLLKGFKVGTQDVGIEKKDVLWEIVMMHNKL